MKPAIPGPGGQQDEVPFANAIEAWGAVWHGSNDLSKHVSCDRVNMHGRLSGAVLPKFGEEGIEHMLLPLHRGIAAIDGAQALPKNPVDFQGIRLDGVVAIDNFAEP